MFESFCKKGYCRCVDFEQLSVGGIGDVARFVTEACLTLVISNTEGELDKKSLWLMLMIEAPFKKASLRKENTIYTELNQYICQVRKLVFFIQTKNELLFLSRGEKSR